MEDRFCPNCGTEIGSDARFCPTCGQVLVADTVPPGEEVDAEPEAEPAPIPPAPAWPAPKPQPDAASEAGLEPAGGAPDDAPSPAEAEQTAADGEPAAHEEGAGEEPAAAARVSPAPPAAPPPSGTAPPVPPPPQGPDTGPLTLPTMLSGWLIGAGAGFGALALLPRLANVLSVLLFVGLLWVTATVFLADRMPQFAHQRLLTLVVILVALGAALDRAGFRLIGVDSIFLVAILVAAAGILLVETGRDRPAPPPGGSS